MLDTGLDTGLDVTGKHIIGCVYKPPTENDAPSHNPHCLIVLFLHKIASLNIMCGLSCPCIVLFFNAFSSSLDIVSVGDTTISLFSGSHI